MHAIVYGKINIKWVYSTSIGPLKSAGRTGGGGREWAYFGGGGDGGTHCTIYFSFLSTALNLVSHSDDYFTR